MAIHSSAKLQNIHASVVAYVQTNWQGSAGVTKTTLNAGTAKFPAANIMYMYEQQNPDGLTYFLRPTIRRGVAEYSARATSTAPGHLLRYHLFLDVFLRREYALSQDDLYLLPKTLDMLRDAIKGTDSITVLNYDGDSQTTLGKLWVRGLEPHEPAEALWLSGGWFVSLEWTEQDASA